VGYGHGSILEVYIFRRGNLFVIRFDQNWQPEVTQLEATISKDAGVEEVGCRS
jgi:hypothetical protein